MRINTVKKALKEGKLQVGCSLSQIRSTEVPTILAKAGFDWTFLDGEHGRAGVETLADLSRASVAAGLCPIVRVADIQYALIARALVHEPRTLLFDEPSNALDIAAQVQLRDTMRELAQSGLGIVLVTHHVSEILPEIERVVLLKDGRIQSDGPKANVLTEENLSTLFGVPLRLGKHDGFFHLY